MERWDNLFDISLERVLAKMQHRRKNSVCKSLRDPQSPIEQFQSSSHLVAAFLARKAKNGIVSAYLATLIKASLQVLCLLPTLLHRQTRGIDHFQWQWNNLHDVLECHAKQYVPLLEQFSVPNKWFQALFWRHHGWYFTIWDRTIAWPCGSTCIHQWLQIMSPNCFSLFQHFGVSNIYYYTYSNSIYSSLVWFKKVNSFFFGNVIGY